MKSPTSELGLTWSILFLTLTMFPSPFTLLQSLLRFSSSDGCERVDKLRTFRVF